MAELPDKIPLDVAAADLSQVANLLEENGDMDYALLKVFGEKQALQEAAVDRNFLFHQYTKSMVQMAKEMEANWKAKKGFLTNVLESHKERLQSILEQNNKIPFRGKQGKIALQKSPPGMSLAIPTVKKTFEMVAEKDIQGLDQERKDRYFPKVLIQTIDKEKIKEDLKAGDQLPFAVLTQDNHVRFRI